jgi:hypothetical protein
MDEKLNGLMSINHKLPKPVAFNCWKHHMGYIKETLSTNDLSGVSHLNIYEIIQCIGDSQIDFYYGSLDPESISNQIISQVELKGALNISEYKEWIRSEDSDYKNIILSDGSTWTARLGQSDERYIHIHPSRYSKKTVRVKSSTLKTVLAYFYHFGFFDDQISVEKVNFVRHKIVKLPSFKATSSLVAVFRISNLFFT